MTEPATVPAEVKLPFPRPAHRPGRALSWKQLAFPSVFLVYLLETVGGVFDHASGLGVVAGVVLVLVFCACYLLAMLSARTDRAEGPLFWAWYLGMLAVTALELPLAHQSAFVMLIYVSVMTVAVWWTRGVPVIACYVLIAVVGPRLLWQAPPDWSTGVAIAIVSLAMYGFFAVLRSNRMLAEARTEVARLATENERARIARDLHDLLGHSLTTITVKAALAHRLTATNPDRAATEIAEVEQLTRRVLSEVRDAVSGYREVTLANELAAAREVLRASGISADLPGTVEEVEPAESELFAWVVREGITNVVRHSRAASCAVRLGRRSIEICDDGTGRGGGSGSGLTGLRERVAAAGGRLSAGPADAGPGWRLRVELPAAGSRS